MEGSTAGAPHASVSSFTATANKEERAVDVTGASWWAVSSSTNPVAGDYRARRRSSQSFTPALFLPFFLPCYMELFSE